WRLYHEDTSVKMDCYYEVNLPELINRIEESGDITLFKYFYLFFRLAAFPQVPLGTSFLDRVREESAAYAQKIGNDLQENVYKAMKVLAEGFYAEQSNSLSHALEDIRDVQDNSMRLLYRLLFIFYAESRKLLNTDNKHYQEMSLRKLKEEISEKMDQGETMLAVRSTYWEGLKDLFRLINDGSEAFGYPKEEFYIPAYNGGLFDPLKNSFLTQKKIGNSYLAEAIDLLARSPGEGKMVFVDYSSLGVRHLGSIYEGILEYKLHLAEVRMVAVKEKGKEVWLPAGGAGKKFTDSVEAGGLYLVTDKGERKATGSFYTPEYIVKHLVKNTLAPLIDPMMWEAIWSEELRKDLLKKLLSIKVLDPAMGSGHFLVEATDYIAREIIHAKEIARHEELESEEIAENDIHWARREVVRNCIYGVDLNPMAVELAKLSLWFTTVASNKPLSFLDHHLRCGNSLIGAELEKLATLPGGEKEQTPLWSFGLKSHTEGLLKRYSLMAALPDDNLQMVKWKEDQFRQIKESELSRRLNELSNVWLSTFFGNKVSDDDYYELQNHLSPEKFPDWAGLREREWFRRAQALAGEKRFFHWELEFPEAFQGEGCGFDVVIGNPPYVRQERLGEDKRYFESKFKVYHSIADLYVYFFERGHEVLRNGGTFGFISSNKFMRSNYGKPLRNYLREGTYLTQIIDFGELPVFPEAATFPAIYLTMKAKPTPASITIYTKVASLEFKSLDSLVASQGLSLSTSAFEGENWSLAKNDESGIMEKLSKISLPLGEYTKGTIKRGILTGLNQVFIIDKSIRDEFVRKDPKSEEILKPIIVGDDIRKYETNYKYKYIIWTYSGIDLDKYPAIRGYLDSFKEKLEKRWDKGNDYYELRACDYYDALKNPKIVYPDIAKESRMTLDRDGLFLTNTAYFIPTEDIYLLSLLNSRLLFNYYKRTASVLGDADKGGRMRWFSQDVIRLPIRRISFTTPAPERARLGTELQQLYADGKFSEILAQVDACLPKDEAGNFITEQEKSDVVHDLLAFLAERMLDMNKQKQTEVKGFLGWLESYLGAKVEDLTPKTKLQGYYEHDYESFLAVL
ncbi:MAG: Eco57I restriction-modification methylase domain-containing protein, partial [Methanothrix sp.]|nr:Eco57I restriction-modification methylase domain-containing protein [Methanothrix sp.]